MVPTIRPGVLTVGLAGCRSLIPADRKGLSDPYVVLSLGHEVVRSTIVMDTLDPDFGEKLVLHVDPAQHTPQTPLRIEVFSEDADRRDHFLGEAEVGLEAVLRVNPTGSPGRLRKRPYPLADPNGRVRPKDLQRKKRQMRSVPSAPPCQTYGSVELSASFVPEYSGTHPPDNQGVVYLSLLQGTDFVPGLAAGCCNPYAKVSIGAGAPQRSNLHHNTTEPIFNEVFRFVLSAAASQDEWTATIEFWSDPNPRSPSATRSGRGRRLGQSSSIAEHAKGSEAAHAEVKTQAHVYLGECTVRLRDEFARTGWASAAVDKLWQLSDPRARISAERIQQKLSQAFRSPKPKRAVGPYGAVRLKLSYEASSAEEFSAVPNVFGTTAQPEAPPTAMKYNDPLSGVWHAVGHDSAGAEPLEEFFVLR